MIDTTASLAIRGYQRFLSPYKGFCCAYRVHRGRRSCSAYASAIVQRLGALALSTAMPRQFERCKLSYAALANMPGRTKAEPNENARKRRWWENCNGDPCGSVDLPCDCSP